MASLASPHRRLGYTLSSGGLYGYTLYNESVTYMDALANCSALGQRLAEVHSPEQYAELVSLRDEYSNDGIWLGARCLDHLGSCKDNGTYVWENSNLTFIVNKATTGGTVYYDPYHGVPYQGPWANNNPNRDDISCLSIR